MKKWLRTLLMVIGLLGIGGMVMVPTVHMPKTTIVTAADSAPAPDTDKQPTPNGFYFPVWPFGYLMWNGITAQPADDSTFVQNTAQIITMTSTYQPSSIVSWGTNNVTSVSTLIYNGGKWESYSTGKPSIDRSAPSAAIGVDLAGGSTKLSVGTYYFQFAIKYSNSSTAYTNVIKVTIVAEPIDAIDFNPQPEQSNLFWGESTTIDANLNPANSTAAVDWTAPDSKYGKISTSSGHSTLFSSTAGDNSSVNAFLKYPNGLPVQIPATVTNSKQAKLPTKSATVTMGGLSPQFVAAGSDFAYLPDAVNRITAPAGADVTYQWGIYNGSYSKLATTSSMKLDAKTLAWSKVPLPADGDHYFLQLDVSITADGHTSKLRSNYTTLTVTAEQPTQLVAVPNLRFMNLASGTAQNPTTADFFNPSGVTLSYVPLATQTGKTAFDGNNTGQLSVKGTNWSLSVTASKFSVVPGASPTELPNTPTLTLGLWSGQDGQKAVPVDGTEVTLLSNHTGDFSTTLDSTTTLHIPQTSFVISDTYHSDLTWTLVKAP